MYQTWQRPERDADFYIPEDLTRQQSVKIDKSNVLLIGPTGVGKTYILEYVYLPTKEIAKSSPLVGVRSLNSRQNPEQETQRSVYNSRL